jgi:ribosomal protein L7/L12
MKGSDADVAHLVAIGRTLDAIKLYRELHGGGLTAAKEAVERIASAGASGVRFARQRKR